MSIGLIISICVALLSGFVVLVGNKNRKTWKETIKSMAIPVILVASCAFLLMMCMTEGMKPVEDNSEFNWDGKPKDQYRHMRKPLIYDGNTYAPSR